MTIFGQNESHLNKLRTHLKSPQLNQAQRLDINRRIQSLLGEVKKSKEIKEKLEGVLIVCILSSFLLSLLEKSTPTNRTQECPSPCYS